MDLKEKHSQMDDIVFVEDIQEVISLDSDDDEVIIIDDKANVRKEVSKYYGSTKTDEMIVFDDDLPGDPHPLDSTELHVGNIEKDQRIKLESKTASLSFESMQVACDSSQNSPNALVSMDAQKKDSQVDDKADVKPKIQLKNEGSTETSDDEDPKRPKDIKKGIKIKCEFTVKREDPNPIEHGSINIEVNNEMDEATNRRSLACSEIRVASVSIAVQTDDEISTSVALETMPIRTPTNDEVVDEDNRVRDHSQIHSTGK